jgi:catalase
MPTRKTSSRTARHTASDSPPKTGSAQSTVSGPSDGVESSDALGGNTLQKRLATKLAGEEAMAAAMPANANKAAEHGVAAARSPREGAHEHVDPAVTASTANEDVESDKLGVGPARPGHNPTTGPLTRVRVDSGNRGLTTNLGVGIADNQNSLKAGLRGPTLLEDFILREKITHFDHERIPERVVHARGSAAHGYFECTQPLTAVTRAAPFQESGKRTPVFVRFSTVAGERGSADTVRDVRGFAVKFYTDEGNWDLVGNNIPVFFIQDAIKFPDLVHAVKPEPHHQMPQASSAHDTFWDFVSLMPESAHMLLWQMSDRAIPRSYRTMQGFGVHTFRFVNAEGASSFVKFHWTPVLGTHSLVWDEAAKITGADPDFHRRDLWEAIEAGAYPEWELQVQVFGEAEAERFSFDVLDATKIVPEELVPLQTVGRMVLNRNPDNFFAETEQVAFCTAHIVPGIDFTPDPLLQGRNFSYLDTQLSRLGGPNFQEIPINAPVVQVHNNQRDGMHRQQINRGRVNYEPNSLGGGCPFQMGAAGFTSFPEPVRETQLRAKPEKFADHYSQATLFWRSQTPVEQNHIIGAFRFELSRVQTPAIRRRVVSVLANIAPELAENVAAGLGMAVPEPQQRALKTPVHSEVEVSHGLSLFARPGDGSVKGRRVALLVAPGCDGGSLKAVHAALLAAEAVPRFVGARLGLVELQDGSTLEVDTTMEAQPSVLWDGVVLPDGEGAHAALAGLGQAVEFVVQQYRHCKPMLVLGAAQMLLEVAGIPPTLPDGSADPGIVFAPDAADGAGAGAAPGAGRGPAAKTAAPAEDAGEMADEDAFAQAPGTPDLAADETRIAPDAESAAFAFIEALARHRHYERETDPPAV